MLGDSVCFDATSCYTFQNIDNRLNGTGIAATTQQIGCDVYWVMDESAQPPNDELVVDEKGLTGYDSGKHCWRMYYSNGNRKHGFASFGIFPNRKPSTDAPYKEPGAWSFSGNDCDAYRDGRRSRENRALFLYSTGKGMVDMLVDFDAGTIAYRRVDGKERGKDGAQKQFELRGFDTSVKYTVCITLGWEGTQVQLAKLRSLSMFGKDGTLVQWNKDYDHDAPSTTR